MNKNEVTKELYKSKAMAKFSHYIGGNLYYMVEVFGELYQFPISTIEPRQIMIGGMDEMDGPADAEYIETIKLSEDLGTTRFEGEVRGSELNRWIGKAIDTNNFIKIN
jgi:hypothetical protein